MTPVRDTGRMIAEMAPDLRDGTFVFCTAQDPTVAAECRAVALATFQEKEGLAAVLTLEDAQRLGFDVSLPMRLITLTVASALDGVGLTAAVSSALADRGIPCNVVAAFFHDHIFVPSPQADLALTVLTDLQRRGG